MDVSEVLDLLYIGGQKLARDKDRLNELGVSFVVNCAHELRNYFEDEHPFRYIKLPVLDSDVADLSPHFDEATEFIHEGRAEGHGVLVHCKLGISRSATIVIAYLIRFMVDHLLPGFTRFVLMPSPDCRLTCWGMSIGEAYGHLRQKRPEVRPKTNFLAQLMRWEKALKSRMKSEIKGSPVADSSRACVPGSPAPGPVPVSTASDPLAEVAPAVAPGFVAVSSVGAGSCTREAKQSEHAALATGRFVTSEVVAVDCVDRSATSRPRVDGKAASTNEPASQKRKSPEDAAPAAAEGEVDANLSAKRIRPPA